MSKKTAFILTASVFAAVLLYSRAPALLQDPAHQPHSARKDCIVKSAWKTHVGPLSYMSFSAGGGFLAIITKSHKLRVFDVTGKECYSVAIPTCDRAVVSRDGRYTLIYSALDPTNCRVTVLDNRGQPYFQTKVSGAIWSADACIVPTGVRFVIGTGKKCVYVVDVGKWRKRYKWWRAPGAVTSVGLDISGDGVYYGTWQKSSVGKADAYGSSIWEAEVDAASLQYLEILNTPRRTLLRSIPNSRGTDGTFYVLDHVGDNIWEGQIKASEKTRVLSSADGRFVCLSYVKTIEHKGKSMQERHSALFGETGARLWDQGSPFFRANALLVSSGGEVVLHNGKSSLFVVRRAGHLESSEKLDSAIDSSTVSRDRSRLVVHCVDGSLRGFIVE